MLLKASLISLEPQREGIPQIFPPKRGFGLCVGKGSWEKDLILIAEESGRKKDVHTVEHNILDRTNVRAGSKKWLLGIEK